MKAICREDEVGPGAACAIEPGLFAVRAPDGRVLIYRNSCPHLGVPLDWAPGRFLNAGGTRIVCATHGAEFRIEDGVCLRGPCLGERLESVPASVLNGMIMADDPGAG